MLPDPSRPGQPAARDARATPGRSIYIAILATALLAVGAMPAFADVAPDPAPSDPNPDAPPVTTKPKPAPKPQTPAPAPVVRTPAPKTTPSPAPRVTPAPAPRPAPVVRAAPRPANPSASPRRHHVARHRKPAAAKPAPAKATPAPAAPERFSPPGPQRPAAALPLKKDGLNAKLFAVAALTLLLLALVSASLTWLLIQANLTRPRRSL
jgi:hypothetical protein